MLNCKMQKYELIKIIKLIRQKMQIKRNSASASSLFNSKTNNLIQPLIGISKASTPLRTRIIGSNNSQINSTPINFNKVSVVTSKSPNNKENFHNNHIKLQSSKKTFTIPSEPQNRINLSPVISLNRKLSEGPKFLQKKSHTPQNHKMVEEYQMNMVNSGRQGQEKRYQTLAGSNSGFNGFNNTANFSNLRGSNSFKNLIEGRCKTPNKLDNNPSGLFPLKKQSAPLLKQSSSSNLFFKNFNNQDSKFQSNLKLVQSKSYDKMKTFSSITSQTNELKCMNNDGKKAKYRVLNNDNDEQKSDIELYYCSKCTIPLVQQGFIVQQIGKESMKEETNQNDRILGDLKQKLQNKKKAFQFILNDAKSKEQCQINQLEMYYNKIFQYLQSQRQKDIKSISNSYNERKNLSKDYIKEIDNKIAQIQTKSMSINKILNDHTISTLIDLNQNHFFIDSKFQINSDLLFNRFVETFDTYLTINLQSNKQVKFNDIGNRNHAMRFSFEKLLNDKNSKKGGLSIKNYMNPLKEQDEEYNQNDDQDLLTGNTAFRDLFPADQQESDHLNNDMTSPTFKKI